ncbi:MAG: hypothetical protein ABIU77_18030 [Ferruginibacter sp.]
MAVSLKHTDNHSHLGFLDGYVAGNISANESELKLHTDKIKWFLSQAVLTFSVIDIQDQTKQSLKTVIESFDSKSFNNLLTVDDFYSYSQDLLEVMSAIKNAIPSEKLPTEANFLIKRAVFHCLTMAKTLNDERITKIAVNIATLFK